MILITTDKENKIEISRLEVADKGRRVLSRELIATVPAEVGTYPGLNGNEVTITALRLSTSRRGENLVGVRIGSGAERPVSIGRDTARGMTLETVGKSAIEVAITDPSLLRPAPKQEPNQTT